MGTFLETLNGYGGKESVEICRYKFYQEMIERFAWIMMSLHRLMFICCLHFVDVNSQDHQGDVLPQFVGDLTNLTAAIGREAVFSCNIKNLRNYKVGWVRADTKAI